MSERIKKIAIPDDARAVESHREIEAAKHLAMAIGLHGLMVAESALTWDEVVLDTLGLAQHSRNGYSSPRIRRL